MPSERASAPFTSRFPNPSAQLQTVITYLTSIADQDAPTILAQLTDDHTYEWIARGFDFLGPRVKDRKATEEFFNKLCGSLFVDYRYEILDYLETPGKIMFHLRGTSGIITDPNVEYENDYVWIFHLTNDEKPKIKVAKEFLDSLYAFQFFNAHVPGGTTGSGNPSATK